MINAALNGNPADAVTEYSRLGYKETVSSCCKGKGIEFEHASLG